MNSFIWKFSPCIELDSPIPHRNKDVITESVNGANSTTKWLVMMINENGEKHIKADSSSTHSVINMVGMLIVLGQLSTPYALQNGGWASAFLFMGLGITCKNEKSRNYSDIGQQAFGMKGRVIATTFIYMEIFMALVSYTISLCDNLTTVFAGTNLHMPWLHLSTSQILTVIAVIVALPSLWLRDLSFDIVPLNRWYSHVISHLYTVLCTAAFGGVKVDQLIPILQLHRIPVIFGLYIFSFAGHIVFPNLCKSMKDPSKFTKVSIVSFSIVTILYTSLTFMGAKMFGPGVNSQITLSMPKHLILTKIALWATVLTPMTKYALEFAPIAMQLDHKLPCSMSSQMRMFIRGSLGSLLLIGILGLALSIPYFQYVLGLTGSLVSTSICIIFPCAFYTKIFWSQHSKPLLFLNFVLIGFGSLCGLFGIL
ncbi:hypothetical protein MKX01_014474 [Papaver californicum]|nr:hypothetical protein MKX01_014474 [Papaver californicum]